MLSTTKDSIELGKGYRAIAISECAGSPGEETVIPSLHA
jgi:hypothetical protein